MPSSRTIMALCTVPAFALAIWQGCSVYGDSLLLPGDGGDGGSDGNTADVNPGCQLRTWPSRPVASDDASVTLSFFNAIRTLDFGTGDAGEPALIGYDLDGVCTCPGPSSCLQYGDSGTQCDIEGGVDNSAGELIKQFSGAGAFFDQGFLNVQLAGGIFGALFRIRDYNGQADDSQVVVEIYTSNGTLGAGTDAGPTIPVWNGNDVWTLDPTSVQAIGDAGPIPPINGAVDPGAYVSNYTLVSNISDMPLAIGASNGTGLVTIDLSAAHVIAKLTPFGSTGLFQATGTVTGRWQSRKLLTSLQVLYDPFIPDAALCGSDSIYQLVKVRVCALEDIATSTLDDNLNPLAPCDALSLAFNFTSVPANYGPIFAKPDAGGGCGPTWTDSCGP